MSEELLIKTPDQVQLDDDLPARESITAILEQQSHKIITDLFALSTKELRLQQHEAVAIRELGANIQREIYRRCLTRRTYGHIDRKYR